MRNSITMMSSSKHLEKAYRKIVIKYNVTNVVFFKYPKITKKRKCKVKKYKI